MSQRRKLRARASNGASAEDDLRRRSQAAEREFRALLERHRVIPVVEQGTSSATGPFTRIVFVDRPAPAPAEPPA